ncbi:MAG TPA: hypothetical protein VJR92_02595 [Gemmatimonadaceae bacterium]|nr:hypothetical protein [Gemmatimonadaceae bacterium]
MQRTIRGLAIAGLTALVACGKDGGPLPPPTEQSVVGEYELRNVNGVLPYLLGGNETQAVFIVSGSFDIRADKSFTDLLTTRINYASGAPSSFQTDSRSGTYNFLGRNLELIYVLPDTTVYDTVAITWNSLHQGNGDLVRTYRK